jgi:hypothetical protein
MLGTNGRTYFLTTQSLSWAAASKKTEEKMKEARDSKGRCRPLLNPHDRALAYAIAELAKSMSEAGRLWLAENCCLEIHPPPEEK